MIQSNLPQTQKLKLLKQSEEQLVQEGYTWNKNRLEINRRAKTVRKWNTLKMAV